MTAYTGAFIEDPDALSATVKLTNETRAADSEVFIDTVNKTIALVIDAGNNVLTSDGVTLKALYSFLKDRWLADASLIKFPFPMTPITDEQFEFYNGWNLDKVTTSGPAGQTTPELIRTGGWAVKFYNTSTLVNGDDTERWASVITLGTLGTTDQVYYQQEQFDNTSTGILNFVLTNTVNQAVQYYRNVDGTGSLNTATNDYNYGGVLNLFCREWEKTYAASSLGDIGVSSLNYQAYRFPLTNAADSKLVSVSVSESAASGNTFAISAGAWAATSATVTIGSHDFIVGDSVNIKGVSPSTWNATGTSITFVGTNTISYTIESDPGSYTSDGTVSGYLYDNMNISWYDEGQNFTGFNVPPGNSAFFEVVIDADVDGLFATNPTAEQIYAFTQSQLRKITNINSSSTVTGPKIGKVVPAKLQFVGDDLYTLGLSNAYEGVYIDEYRAADANRLHFWGYGSSDGAAYQISSITQNTGTGVVTVVTTATNGFSTDDYITVSGVTETEFNGSYQITVSNGTTFTYTLDPAGTTPTGTTSTNSLVKPTEYTNIQFPFTAILTLNFGSFLVSDSNAIYRVFFSNNFGTKDALLVNKKNGDPMSGTISGNASIPLEFDYDGTPQVGSGRNASEDANVTAVAIGLGTAQYVSQGGKIEKLITNSISLVAAQERNYSVGSA